MCCTLLLWTALILHVYLVSIRPSPRLHLNLYLLGLMRSAMQTACRRNRHG